MCAAPFGQMKRLSRLKMPHKTIAELPTNESSANPILGYLNASRRLPQWKDENSGSANGVRRIG